MIIRILPLILTFLIIQSTKLNAQEHSLPIDSLYLNSIEPFYQFAEEHKDEIWPGMELSPVILYRTDGPAFLYNHPEPPEEFMEISDNLYVGSQNELRLFGDTITEINGTLTAIVNYGRPEYGTADQVLATLFHELHHAYQVVEFPGLSPGNAALGLTYPEIIENDALKLFEQQLLYKMSFVDDENTFSTLLNQFYSSRKIRENILESYSDFEQSVESFEGPAFYSEYKFYQLFSKQPEPVKKNYFHNHFWSPLNTFNYGRQNLRNKHLAYGFAMCYILSRHHPGWKTGYYNSGMTLFEYFVSKFEPEQVELPELEAEFAKSRYHTKNQIDEREAELAKFYGQPGTKVILDFQSTPQFRGFDPVNTIAIDNSTILHKNSLRLEGDESQLFLENREIVTIVRDQVFFVEQAILFVPAGSIELKQDKIVIEGDGVSIRWTGEITSQEENLITFRAD